MNENRGIHLERKEPKITRAIQDIVRVANVAIVGGEANYARFEIDKIAKKIFAHLKQCQTMEEAVNFLQGLVELNGSGGVPLRPGLPNQNIEWLYSGKAKDYYLLKNLADEAQALAQAGEAHLCDTSFDINTVSPPLRSIVNRIRNR